MYKTLIKVNPGYMNDIYKFRNTDRPSHEKYTLKPKTPKPNLTTFGTSSLRRYVAEIWNPLP